MVPIIGKLNYLPCSHPAQLSFNNLLALVPERHPLSANVPPPSSQPWRHQWKPLFPHKGAARHLSCSPLRNWARKRGLLASYLVTISAQNKVSLFPHGILPCLFSGSPHAALSFSAGYTWTSLCYFKQQNIKPGSPLITTVIPVALQLF